MRTSIHAVSIFILFAFFMQNSFAYIPTDIPEGITAAIKSGNSRELAKYFDTNIELVILDKEDVYSRTQAELILKDFFSKHKPTNFTIIHRGGEGAKYAIGTLFTSNGNFRVYILLKTKNEKPYIHSLRIEEEDE